MKTVMRQIDVCVVAGRRPELLRTTLESFERNLFRNFRIARFIVNIDPIFGSAEDETACLDVIRAFAKSATVSTPTVPNFASAVGRNWEQTTSDVILHLEDDWVLKKQVLDDDVAWFDKDEYVGQISFNHANKNWDARKRGHFAYARRRLKVFGLPTPFKTRFPVFTTSPGFLRGTFAREAARLLHPAFDPEKQFYKSVNPSLEAYVMPFKNRVIGDLNDYHIVDIGREWRNQRNVQKTMVNWQSQWVGG